MEIFQDAKTSWILCTRKARHSVRISINTVPSEIEYFMENCCRVGYDRDRWEPIAGVLSSS